MIEDGLFLALGFCIAVVLALAALPLLWARALRLTRQRLELLVPWSKEEIDAERDGLRAQAAVQHRRLERDAERSHAALARRTGELGQRTVDLVRMESDRDALRTERQALVSELTGQQRDLREADAQRFAAEKALHDADRHIETDAAALRTQAQRFAALSQTSDAQRGEIAALHTRIEGLQATVRGRDDALSRLDSALAASASAQAALATEHGRLSDAFAALRQEHGAAQRSLAEAEGRIREQDMQMKHADERLRALQKRFDALAEDLAAAPEGATDPAGQDARLRQAIVAAGDDALRILAPAGDDPSPLVGTHR